MKRGREPAGDETHERKDRRLAVHFIFGVGLAVVRVRADDE